VLAAAAGRIEKIFESERGGHTIYVRSPDGRWVYYYAHLDAYAPGIAEGQAVSRGQQIATVGSTGRRQSRRAASPFRGQGHVAGADMVPGTGHQPVPSAGRHARRADRTYPLRTADLHAA
jgi:hypothetical protein